MNKLLLKKVGLVILSVLLVIYAIFIILPFCINPFVERYSDKISDLAEKTCGLKIKIEQLKLVTTLKLTAGVKVRRISIKLPTGDDILVANNAQAKLSILPLLIGRIEADAVSADTLDANLNVKPDGNLQIIDYLPAADPEDETKEQMTSLPMGFKLSNRMPNILIKEYLFSMIDMRDSKRYSIQGSDLKVSDFVLNKNVKFSTYGVVRLDEVEQFKYNLKITNKIMPDIDINDLVFGGGNSPAPDENNESAEPITFNIIDIFKGIKKNGLTANANMDIKTSGKFDDIHVKGLFDIKNLTMLVNGKQLPEGRVKFDFQGKKTLSQIVLYTAEDEHTTIIGEINHGKSPKIDLSVNSKAKINNIFAVIKSIASSFNYNDLETLTASGAIDADFNLKSNMKKVESDGYFRIPSASVRYSLYNILIDSINADVDFSGNSINLKNLGFTILNQPLKAYGTISNEAVADLHLTADKLLLKGLLAAAGQVGLLKDNDIKSGTISMDAVIKGRLNKIEPVVDISVDEVNILNKPSSTSLSLAQGKVNISSDTKTYKGQIESSDLKIDNPSAKFSLPKAKITLDTQNINIADTYLMIDNSKIDISGKVADYTTKNLAINLKAKGNVFANDLKNMLPKEYHSMLTAKGAIPLLVSITGNDKKQTINFQALATPSGYLHVTDLSAVSGKSTLINSKVLLNGNSLKFEDTGLYVSSGTSLSDLPDSNFSGVTPSLMISGEVADFSNPQLKNFNIATNGIQTISVPSFKNSSASVKADVTLNGYLFNPDFKGNIYSDSISLPSIKTTLKNVSLSLGKSIDLDLPLITVDNSDMKAKAVISKNFSNGVIINNVDFNGNLIDADTLAAAFAGLSSGSGTTTSSGSSASTSGSSDLGIVIREGKGSVVKFKSGNITATNLTSDFNLKNNVFSLKNLKGDSFGGKIDGSVSCNIISGKTSVDMTGTGMNAVNAISAAAGIPNALSGVLDFTAKLTLNAFATPFNSLLNSINGNVTFNVKDGHYANIGTLDSLILAQNIAANALLKAVIAPVRNMPVVQNASNFDTLNGSITLAKGIATLNPVKSAGPSLAYYVTGKYNLINGYTDVVILGRMGADVVAVLGPLGELSASKLTSYIPKFGTQTASILNALTSNPASEKTSEIPALSNGSQNYKDFKVIFTGNVTSASSIKSFKWLSVCDTSSIEGGSLKEQLKTSTEALKNAGQNNIEDVKNTVEDIKNAAKDTADNIKQQIENTKDSIQDLKNLKNLFKKSDTTTPAVSE